MTKTDIVYYNLLQVLERARGVIVLLEMKGSYL